MAIAKKPTARVTAADKSTSVHLGNGGKVEVPKTEQLLKNNEFPDTLTAPEGVEPGDTHFSVTAAADSTNIGTLDSDENPADGYLPGETEPGADAGPEIEIGADATTVSNGDMPAAEAVESPDDLTNNNAPQELETAADEEFGNDDDTEGETDIGDDEDADGNDDSEDWDAPLPEEDDEVENLDDDAEADVTGDDEFDDADGEEDLDGSVPGEELSLLDVDGTDDSETNIAFAHYGNKVHVLHANRIIATMSSKQAATANVKDIYRTDTFETVVATEIKDKGLRAGLMSTGFVLAKVNVSSSKVVAKLVEQEVHKTTAAIRSVNAAKDETMTQALAIAAVGMNRKVFKASNVLKDGILAELTAAGVTGAEKMLNRAFATNGPAFAKDMVTLANRIAAMPEEVRAGYVDMLDMTDETEDEGGVFDDGDDMDDELPDGNADMDEEFDDEVMSPSTVGASLATAGFARTAHKQITQTSVHASKAVLLNRNLSPGAAALLAGKKQF